MVSLTEMKIAYFHPFYLQKSIHDCKKRKKKKEDFTKSFCGCLGLLNNILAKFVKNFCLFDILNIFPIAYSIFIKQICNLNLFKKS